MSDRKLGEGLGMRLAINLSSQLTRCEVRVKLDDLPGEDKEILWSYFTLN